VVPVSLDDPAAAEALAWAEEVRATRRVIVELVSGGAPLASLPGLAADLGTPRARGGEVLAATRIGVLAVARPDAGKVATRRRLAALGLDELTAFGEIPAALLEALDSTTP